MSIILSRIRKPWAILLVWYVMCFVVGLYPYLTVMRSIQPIQIMQIALDAVAIYGLFGYVTRKPIRNLALRLLYLTLVLVFCVRVGTVIYFVAPNLHPWVGAHEQYVSIFILTMVPASILVATALWFYATKRQQEPETLQATSAA